ncbi:MAG: TlpA family protein disulfide reductase [Gammaproteobacteria bacterium]|nr:TlpA family protein disulfide reductase [Gammaproteobacteria bacterium]
MKPGTLRGCMTVLAGTLLLNACGESERPAVADIPTGQWRVEFAVPGGMVPVGLELGMDDNGMTATFINGSERVDVPTVTQSGRSLTLAFPAFNNRLEGEWDGRSLSGNLTIIRRGGELQSIPFRARPGVEYRFVPAQASAEANLEGRWRVTFTDEDGVETPAIGEFSQQGNQVQGTFLTETGDYRFLAGEVVGRQMLLSTFDGAHLFLFSAELGGNQQLTGDFWSSVHWHETWTGVRDDDAQLADAYSMTFLKPGYDAFTFRFPDTDGNMVSLDDERFEGKVVLVTLAGTWCPNCHDEARFLAEYYRQRFGDGLEVVGLMYEHFEDFETAAEQVRRFRAELGIEYTLLVAGYSDKQKAAETLPMLNRVLAFPTTIFLGRDGKLRRIHTGFTGPGTGEHYARFIAQFKDFVGSLLAEPPL